MKTAHAILSPSGAERWMSCPGSVAMERDCPGETNEYADEGTAAHALASMCLTTNNDPAAYAGRVLQIVNGVYWPGDPTPEPALLKGHIVNISRDFEVDDSMIENVRTYVNSIREYASVEGAAPHIEQRVPIDHITGEPEAEGSSDAIIELPDEIQVHDLKYGRGVAVVTKNNKQGMMYALGALRKFDLTGNVKRVRIVIHQPRLNNAPDEWDVDVGKLSVFEEYARNRAKEATATLDMKPAEVLKHLRASEYACRFCKAKGTCPELARTVSEAVFGDFETLDKPVAGDDHPLTKAANKILEPLINKTLEILAGDPNMLSIRMSKVEMIEDWCKAIRAKTDLLLRNGEKVAGWKLVVGKKGNRKWCDENAAIKLMKAMRLKITEMYTMKVLTPTKAEAFFKSTPKRWAQLVALFTQEPGNAHVAPESDTRPAYVAPNAADDFAASDGSDLA